MSLHREMYIGNRLFFYGIQNIYRIFSDLFPITIKTESVLTKFSKYFLFYKENIVCFQQVFHNAYLSTLVVNLCLYQFSAK